MRHILITGTNRGIGYELARQYMQTPDTHVLCTVRADQAKAVIDLSSTALARGNQFSLIHLDVTDADSQAQAVAHVQASAPQLDVLILNAGINPDVSQDIDSISAETMRQVFEVNTLAPLMLTQAFLPLLRKASGAKIIYMTSGMASLADRTYGGSHAYCVSKAGLNMVMRGAAAELHREGITAIALDPGWVKTDMGGAHAPLTPTDSVRGIIRVIDRLTLKDSGQFLRWDGQQNEW